MIGQNVFFHVFNNRHKNNMLSYTRTKHVNKVMVRFHYSFITFNKFHEIKMFCKQVITIYFNHFNLKKSDNLAQINQLFVSTCWKHCFVIQIIVANLPDNNILIFLCSIAFLDNSLLFKLNFAPTIFS